MEKMQKLNLRMQKLNFPGTHWRGLALIGAQKKPCIANSIWGRLEKIGFKNKTYIFDIEALKVINSTIHQHKKHTI